VSDLEQIEAVGLDGNGLLFLLNPNQNPPPARMFNTSARRNMTQPIGTVPGCLATGSVKARPMTLGL
jgi:hypothetical protein